MPQNDTTLTIPTPRGRMQLAPVPSEEDELIKAIEDDSTGVGDEEYWDLHDTIDPDKLDAFWRDALKDLGGMPPEDIDN